MGIDELGYPDDLLKKREADMDTPAEVIEGMVLARDIVTHRGVLLVPAGNRLTVAHLQKVLAFHRPDPITESICILKPG